MGAVSSLNLGMVYLIMPILMWVVLARLRSPVVALWCLGSLLGAGAHFLVGFYAVIPGWLNAPVVNLLDFTSLLCTVQALRLDQGVPWRLRGLALASLGFLLVAGVCRNVYALGLYRLAFVPLVQLFLVLQVVGWAWRIARRQKSVGALTIAISHVLASVGMLLVLAELLFPRGGVVACPRDASGLTDTLGMLAGLAGDVGFIGLALERSLHLWTKAADRQARMEERQVLGAQLAHLDRQRGFGLVAASLAHELNQPLTAILASAQAAQRGTAASRLDQAQGLELLARIILNTRRISGITERIRSFIRPSEPDPGPVDLEKITREMLDLVNPELRRQGVRVTFPAGGAPVQVEGDAIQLSQVVLNILRNAIEAVEAVQDRSIQIQLTRSASEALLTIRDTGLGIDPGLAERVGMPYFTTKDEGLGLGLSLSIAILRQHQGSLVIGNAEGGGARVDIRLPLPAAGGVQP